MGAGEAEPSQATTPVPSGLTAELLADQLFKDACKVSETLRKHACTRTPVISLPRALTPALAHAGRRHLDPGAAFMRRAARPGQEAAGDEGEPHADRRRVSRENQHTRGLRPGHDGGNARK
ncbi:MAG: hypothetical protein ACPIOQ_82355, partial [Promethearchaeia archaeon]